MAGPLVLGVDVGQARDHPALVAVEARSDRQVVPRPHWRVRAIDQVPLGLPYAQLADRVVALVDALVARTPSRPVVVVLDATGIGRAVAELLAPAEGLVRVAHLVPVTWTAGKQVTQQQRGVGVPKRMLIESLVADLQQRRVTIPPGLANAATLASELRLFTARNAPGRRTPVLGAASGHDDLVAALALACWWGNNWWTSRTG